MWNATLMSVTWLQANTVFRREHLLNNTMFVACRRHSTCKYSDHVRILWHYYPQISSWPRAMCFTWLVANILTTRKYILQRFWLRANILATCNICSFLRANVLITYIVFDYIQSFCHEQVQVFWFCTKILRRCGLCANILTACKYFDITACKYLLRYFKY